MKTKRTRMKKWKDTYPGVYYCYGSMNNSPISISIWYNAFSEASCGQYVHFMGHINRYYMSSRLLETKYHSIKKYILENLKRKELEWLL